MKHKFLPIETEVGIISGKDAIYLDEIKYDYSKQSVNFIGELNSGLCSKTNDKDEFLKYSLTFFVVLYFQMVELDFTYLPEGSSFDLVQDSNLINKFKKFDSASKVKAEHNHYFLHTYDDVFEIVCLTFELKLLEKREQK